jgi:hypothetical protein
MADRHPLVNLSGVIQEIPAADVIPVADLPLVTPVQTITDGATLNWDWSTGNRFRVTLGGNRTLAAPSNATDGQIVVLEVKQDGTGSRTLTMSAFEFGTDITSITLTTGANKVDLITFYYNSSLNMYFVLGCQKGFN